MPLKGRTSWRHPENMSKKFYGSSKFEIHTSCKPKREIRGTEQHRVWSFSWCFHFPVRLTLLLMNLGSETASLI